MFKLNGQTLPEPSYPITDPCTTDNADPVEYVDVGDDDECGDAQIPGDIRSLLKKVTNAPLPTQHDNSPDNEAQASNDTDGTDDEDAPDWEFDSNEQRSPDPLYEFCPAPHRKQLLSIITRHFCRHHFFPTRSGVHQSPADICNQCVCEMYMFCKRRGLTEVWAYMWNSWYSLSMWNLWARSSRSDWARLRGSCLSFW